MLVLQAIEATPALAGPSRSYLAAPGTVCRQQQAGDVTYSATGESPAERLTKYCLIPGAP